MLRQSWTVFDSYINHYGHCASVSIERNEIIENLHKFVRKNVYRYLLHLLIKENNFYFIKILCSMLPVFWTAPPRKTKERVGLGYLRTAAGFFSVVIRYPNKSTQSLRWIRTKTETETDDIWDMYETLVIILGTTEPKQNNTECSCMCVYMCTYESVYLGVLLWGCTYGGVCACISAGILTNEISCTETFYCFSFFCCVKTQISYYTKNGRL